MAVVNEKAVQKQSTGYSYQLTDSEWKKKLSSQEYRVLRNKGTEPARSGKYDKMYICVAQKVHVHFEELH